MEGYYFLKKFLNNRQNTLYHYIFQMGAKVTIYFSYKITRTSHIYFYYLTPLITSKPRYVNSH